jgi:hypothetical protein
VGGVGGAAIGNSVTNHGRYHRGYANHPFITTTINNDQSTTSGVRTSSRSTICRVRAFDERGVAPRARR